MNKTVKITLCVVGGAAIIGTGGFFAAPAIAAYLGGAGLLGATATTGTVISDAFRCGIIERITCGAGRRSCGSLQGGGIAMGTARCRCLAHRRRPVEGPATGAVAPLT